MSKFQLTDKSQNFLEGLKPEASDLFTKLVTYCQEDGMNIQISDGLRTLEDQAFLYSIGRTRKGKVTTNAKPGYSYHNFGYAVDFFIINPDGKGSWDERFFKRIWKIGQQYKLDTQGLEWSGNWTGSLRESCHFQLNRGTLAELRQKAGL